MITGPVSLDAPITTDELWESIKKAFWAIDSDKLDNLAHAKTATIINIHKHRGNYTKQAPHSEYRKLKNKYKRPPTCAECTRHASKKIKWVYEYYATCREGSCARKNKKKTPKRTRSALIMGRCGTDPFTHQRSP